MLDVIESLKEWNVDVFSKIDVLLRNLFGKLSCIKLSRIVWCVYALTCYLLPHDLSNFIEILFLKLSYNLAFPIHFILQFIVIAYKILAPLLFNILFRYYIFPRL